MGMGRGEQVIRGSKAPRKIIDFMVAVYGENFDFSVTALLKVMLKQIIEGILMEAI